jgi:L-lactate dehydrogenase complex protein LldG
MSIDLQAFEQSLTSVGVAAARVPPDEVAAAIEQFTTGPTVGVSLDRDGVDLPDSVDVDPTAAALEEATTGVTPAAFGIADYGSLVLPSTDGGSELVSLFVDHHVAVLDEADVVPDMKAAFERFARDIPEAYGDAIIATGPSATADMGALVKGAHGPSEVRVVVVEA